MGVRILLLLILLLYAICGTGYASWTGPTVEIFGALGEDSGQFAVRSQDSQDIFPTSFAVSPSGHIAVSEDQTLKRVQLFKAGKFERVIETYAFDLVYLNGDLFVSGGGFRKYDSAGNLIWSKPEASFVALYATFEGNIIGYNRKEKKYYLYSPAGQLIKTSVEKPLELGVAKEQALGLGQYKTTVAYPISVYTFVSDREYDRFVRDSSNNIYGILPGLVDKYNLCGKRMGRLILPGDSVFRETPPPTDREREVIIHDQYGEPIVDTSGNVYTWKKSPAKYSILKWTWVDEPNAPSGPDAPSGLTVTPSTSGLYLTWTASPQDPGCVTNYEISRATSAGGVATVLTTVAAGVVKYNDSTATAGTTYYYKIRAKAGSEFSPYTAEVSGKK